MIDINKGLNKVMQFVNNCSYSMTGSRYYTDGTNDCSGSVYWILRNSGSSKINYIPSTETLHAYLIQNGYYLLAENSDFPMTRGDVIIWGRKGYSGGAGGHTGVALDNQNWVECTAWKDTTIISNHDQRWVMAGSPYFYVYRLKDQFKEETKEEQKFENTKELEKMEFLFTAEGQGATFYYDGNETIMLDHKDELNMIVGNYEQATGKKLPSVRQFTKEEYKIWLALKPMRVIKYPL